MIYNQEIIKFFINYYKDQCPNLDLAYEDFTYVNSKNEVKYYFNNEWHSEKQMLRLIKLKAFL